jgi:hypothetical protein
VKLWKGAPIGEGLRLPVRRAVIANAFGTFKDLSCHLGSLQRSFRFDSRCFDQPVLHGPVVASLSVSRSRSAILQCYAVPQINCGAAAVEEFEKVVVPHLVFWLQTQIARPETAVLGYEEIIVTWNGGKHEYAQVKFR